jgi:hypothetical protein
MSYSCPEQLGGIGLNITTANVVIQCGPWWKKEWEIQAVKRAWRKGRLEEVTYILLEADCPAEAYEAGVRDEKYRFNSGLGGDITRPSRGVMEWCIGYVGYV